MSETYHSHILDHLGLVAGMVEELGIVEVIDQATKQDPEMHIVTAGHAVKAMILNGLGFVNQQLYLVPHFFHNKPTSRLVAPGIDARHLNDDTLGRALDTLYAVGVTEIYSLIAATAAKRLGLTPTFMHLDSTSFHVDGRYERGDDTPDHVITLTRGYSRDHRPDLNQVMLDLMVEHQAGLPVLMKPLSGNSSDTQDFAQIIQAHLTQLQITYGATYVVADSALYSAENLRTLAQTDTKWITRVPATLGEAHEVLRQARPETMAALAEGYRYQVWPSSYGGVEQRWLVIHSTQRQEQARRRVAKQWRKQSDDELKAWKKLCGTAFACEADAHQALAQFTRGLQATSVQHSAIRATPRYSKRGRPTPGQAPSQIVYYLAGALASSWLTHSQRVTQQSCFILATNELDEHRLTPPQLLAGYKGQKHAERGFRFLKAPQFLASSLYLKKAERIMALLMVMTVCLLVYTALEYRIRTVLQANEASFPDQKGKRIHNPTARWVFHYFVGIHLLYRGREYPLVLNLTADHENLLRLLGNPYTWFYGVKNS